LILDFMNINNQHFDEIRDQLICMCFQIDAYIKPVIKGMIGANMKIS